MTKMSDFRPLSGQAEDSWAEQDKAMQQHNLFNSEGEDLGAAMGYFAVGTAVLCVAGIAVAALVLRSKAGSGA